MVSSDDAVVAALCHTADGQDDDRESGHLHTAAGRAGRCADEHTNLDVSFVASTDYIAIPASAVSKGAEVVMPVELVNTTEVILFYMIAASSDYNCSGIRQLRQSVVKLRQVC